MSTKLKSVLCLLLFAPVWLLLYTFLHEGGHALVILAGGGTIDRFWPFGLNAHVSAHGGQYSIALEGLKHAAGVLLPILISLLALVFYNPGAKADGYHYCAFLMLVTPVFSLLVWVVFPVLTLFTPMPPGEDVMQFLDATSIHPLFVSFGAFLIAGAVVFMMHKKGLLKKVFGKIVDEPCQTEK